MAKNWLVADQRANAHRVMIATGSARGETRIVNHPLGEWNGGGRLVKGSIGRLSEHWSAAECLMVAQSLGVMVPAKLRVRVNGCFRGLHGHSLISDQNSTPSETRCSTTLH